MRVTRKQKDAKKKEKYESIVTIFFFRTHEIGAILGVRFREKSPTFNITKSMSGDSVLSDDPDDPDVSVYTWQDCNAQ